MRKKLQEPEGHATCVPAAGMERIFSALAIGALALGGRHAWRHMKSKRKARAQKARLEVWEGEGGAVPVAPDRTAAQVTPSKPSPGADK